MMLLYTERGKNSTVTLLVSFHIFYILNTKKQIKM